MPPKLAWRAAKRVGRAARILIAILAAQRYGDTMNYILYAVPFFFALIALELLVDRWRGVSNYRLADAINSLSAGVLSTTAGLLTRAVGLVIYTLAWQQLALFELSAEALWVWLLAFVFYDFCYYWNHRLGHERNVLWAAHSVHHQSEDYNLSTALSQTSTGFIFGWIFYLPMALAGVPPLVFLTVAALNLLYQFWVHTRHIPKLGWFEWLFVSPSNHRVHHAQNAVYAVQPPRAPCAECCVYGSQLRRCVHSLGPAVWHLSGRAGRRTGDLRCDHAAGQLESAVGQCAVLCGAMARCAPRRILVGQAAHLVYAHRLAAGRCGGQVPAGQAGSQPVRQIRGAAGACSATLCGGSVQSLCARRHRPAGPGCRAERGGAVTGPGLDGRWPVRDRRLAGEPPNGQASGAAASGVQPAGGLAGAATRPVAGTAAALAVAAELQPAQSGGVVLHAG